MAKVFQRLSSKFKRRSNDDEIVNEMVKIPVLIYDKTKEGDQTTYQFGQDDTCEDVCRKLGERHNISPALLYCFSLGLFRATDKGWLWLGPQEKLRSVVDNETVHFRMRFVPALKGESSELQLQDIGCLHYLYWQMKWDFVHDKLEIYKKREKREASRGVVVLCILIMVRIESEVMKRETESLKDFGKQNNIKSFFPNSLEGNVLDDTFQTRGVMDKVEEYLKKASKERCDSTYLMKACVKYLLGEDKEENGQYYYTERYDVHREGTLDKNADLRVIVKMGNEQASVTIQEKSTVPKRDLFCSLIKDIDAIELNHVGEVYNVTIRMSAQSKSVYFRSRREAISCVTCVEMYYRLTCYFYNSLCLMVEPADMALKKKLRVHGPVTDGFLKQKLLRREKMSDSGGKQPVYILRGSQTEYDAYEVVYKDDKSGHLKKIPLGKVVVEKSDCDMEKKLKLSIRNAIVENARKNGVSELVNWLRLNPQSEGCDVLQAVLLEENQTDLEDEAEEEVQAKVFRASAVKVHSLIGQGHFSETYEAKLYDRENVVAKQLRYTEIPNGSFKQVQEAFQDSCDKLIELRNPRFFAELLGVVMSRTPSVLMKQYKHGNLRCFLQTREPREHQLTLRHLCDVMMQIASALDFMEEKGLCHGNLHCDNILVDKFERNEMTVHISDPGLIILYNKLGHNSQVNKRRLPWIAPEMYENLFRTTNKTDMFAFGTTLWQMFSEGKNPLDIEPALKNKTATEVCEFFNSGDKCLSRPLYLKVKKDDSQSIETIKDLLYKQLMKPCWTLDQEDRIDPKAFLRTFNGTLQSYGTDYHDYNIIPELWSAQYPLLSGITYSSSNRSSDSSGVVSAIQTCEMPSRDLRLLYSRQEIRQSGTVKESSPRQNPAPPESPGNAETQGEPDHGDDPGTCLHGERIIVPVTADGLARPLRVGPLPSPPVSNVRHLIAEERLGIEWNIKFGEGHYGAIYKGVLAPTSNLGLREPTAVAVKVLKDNVVNEFGHEFIEEAKVMEMLDHKNIVKFYGVSRQGQYLIMELVGNGCLYTFVKKKGDRCTYETLLKFCVDIAAGMEYLSDMKVLHRDLAARNVLITQNLGAKISDFGMSKILKKDEEYYRRARNVDKNMPVLWSAPEWIGKKKFTSKSDVWSFGVVLWEVYSKGSVPNICKDLEDFRRNGIKKLSEGQRLKKPERCSDEVYDLMKNCWEYVPEKRPSFTVCHSRLKVIAGIVDEESLSDHRDDYSVTSRSNRLVPNRERNGILPVANGHITVPLTNGHSTAPPVASPRSQELQINGGVFSVPITAKMMQQGRGEAAPGFLKKSEVTEEPTKLGKGGFGEVYKGKYLGQQVAIKKCTRENQYHRFTREIDILYTLKHRNIIEFIGVIRNGGEDGKKLELVLEFMNKGSLLSCLKNRSSSLSLADKMDCLIQIAEGMAYLYTKKILHGDLTADNVLVSVNNGELVAKISDFGWAKQLEGTDVDLSYTNENRQCRAKWTAYEVLKKSTYTKYSDIWSYGCLAMEVFGDGNQPDMDPPLNKDQQLVGTELLQRLSKGERFFRPDVCPIDLYSTITRCWTEKPSDRIQYDVILQNLERAGVNNQM